MKTSKRNSSSLFKRFKYPVLLIALIAIFFWPVILKGLVPLPGDFVVGVYYPWLDYKWGYEAGVPVKNPITTDVVSFTYPMQTLAIDIMKSGEWPLWNPLILGGAPLLANFQSAPFSPTNFVYFIFDKVSAWSVQIVFQHVIAAIFAYLLLRRWKVSQEGSILGGVIYSFAGFNLIWSQWNGHTLASGFIPLLILLTDIYLSTGNVLAAIGFSVGLSMQILSGYPQVVMYTALAIFLYWIFRFSRSQNYLKKTIILAIFGFVGLGLSAFQILPGAELMSLSQREVEPHPYEWAFLPWTKVITFLAPDYFGNHSTQNYWGPQDYTSNTGFVGVSAIIFSVLALVSSKNKNKMYLIALSFFSLILSFPTPLSVWIWKSGLMGLQAASAHRALVLWNLSIALLAGMGIDSLLITSFKKRIVSLFIPLLILSIYFVYTFYLYKVTINVEELSIVRGIPKYYVGLRNLIFPLGIFVFISAFVLFSNKLKQFKGVLVFLLILITAFEMYRFGWKFTPFVPRSMVYPETPVLSFLKEQKIPFRATGSHVIPINLRMPYGLESLEGYDAVYPLVSSQFVSAINQGKSGTLAQGRYATVDNDTSDLLDIINVKYYLALKTDERGNRSPTGSPPQRFLNSKFKKIFEDKTTLVFESEEALPRAFVSYNWEIKRPEDTLDSMISEGSATRKIFIEEDPEIEKPNSVGKDEIEFINYGSQGSEIKVNTSEDGILFISDTYFPGWKVYIDGKEARFIRTNFAFRGLPITKGEHIVKYKYRPESFFLGGKIALISAGILIAAFYLRHKLNLNS